MRRMEAKCAPINGHPGGFLCRVPHAGLWISPRPRLSTASLRGMRTVLLPLIAIAVITCPIRSHAQSGKPLFEGAELLDTCLVELPLTYAKKDKERYTQAARFLEGEELIYAVLDKKTRKVNCTRVFVVVERSKDSTEVIYLETADQHMQMDGLKQAYFPKFKPATERFYSAECFDKRLSEHPELKEHVVEAPAEGPR
jgi:hypothetical protein